MKLKELRWLLTAFCLAIAIRAGSDAVALPEMYDGVNSAQETLHVDGPEEAAIRRELPDGGLPPVFGCQSFQVFRAGHDRPDLADGRGWTYNHHMDLACWQGRLYVGWESGEKDEDIWPAHELFSTSVDGMHWSAPQELFPQGLATPLRMYFFHAPNGRMLALAGARIDQAQTTEKRKGPLVVREIRSDHSLGSIYTLRALGASTTMPLHPPLFTQSDDPGFIRACDQLLANRPFLEQQDYGNLLGPRAMSWHDPARWPQGKYSNDDVTYFGKALSFYHRQDGKLVGVAKKGWVTVSADEGETWSEPIVPPSLVTWTAKVWGQRTADGRYALVYNPLRKGYYPLVVVSGEDGIHYRDMRVVYGEAPIMRYAGRAKETGPRYVRGISEWSSDGSRRDQALWVVYSVNEEDIWVSRSPFPSAPQRTVRYGMTGTTHLSALWCRNGTPTARNGRRSPWRRCRRAEPNACNLKITTHTIMPPPRVCSAARHPARHICGAGRAVRSRLPGDRSGGRLWRRPSCAADARPGRQHTRHVRRPFDDAWALSGRSPAYL